jgi:hypothetical protein
MKRIGSMTAMITNLGVRKSGRIFRLHLSCVKIRFATARLYGRRDQRVAAWPLQKMHGWAAEWLRPYF